MINRLRYKCPPPLKTPFNDPTIYTKDGHVKEEILPFCMDLKIDPLDLCIKLLEDFARSDISENVQTLRYNAYEARRQLKVELIKGAIKDHNDPRKNKYPLLAPPEHRLNNSFTSAASPLPTLAMEKGKNRPLTTIDEKKASGAGGGGLFITDLNMSRFNPQNTHPGGLVEARGGKFRAETTKHVRRDAGVRRSGSMDTLADEKNENAIRGELRKDFERSMDVRVKEGERMLNASMLVVRQDQEYRDKMREEYENKSKKWNKTMMKLMKERKKKLEAMAEADKMKAEKVFELKKNEKAQRRQKYIQMCNKLDEVEKKRAERMEDRAKRMSEQSRVYEERLNLYLEKKVELEEDNVMALSNIEEKLMSSEMRKQNMLNSRMGVKPVKIVVPDLGERKAMKAEENEMIKTKALQKYMKDMLKRMKFEVKQEKSRPKKDKLPSVIKSKEHAERLMEVRTKEKAEEKKAINEMRERELKSSRRIERQRMLQNEYGSERKEVNMNRSDIAKSYRLLIDEADERRMDDFFMDYKDKMDNFAKEKEEMKQKREKTADIYRGYMDKRNAVMMDLSIKSD